MQEWPRNSSSSTSDTSRPTIVILEDNDDNMSTTSAPQATNGNQPTVLRVRLPSEDQFMTLLANSTLLDENNEAVTLDEIATGRKNPRSRVGVVKAAIPASKIAQIDPSLLEEVTGERVMAVEEQHKEQYDDMSNEVRNKSSTNSISATIKRKWQKLKTRWAQGTPINNLLSTQSSTETSRLTTSNNSISSYPRRPLGSRHGVDVAASRVIALTDISQTEDAQLTEGGADIRIRHTSHAITPQIKRRNQKWQEILVAAGITTLAVAAMCAAPLLFLLIVI